MLHCFCPFRLLEADQNEVVGDEHRALYEHSVRCEQGVHLVLGHAGELILQSLLLKLTRVEHISVLTGRFPPTLR